MPSNLPEPTYSGTLVVAATVDIDAPIEKVWEILLNCPKYKEWNPFMRSQVITDEHKTPLQDQTPAAGTYLLMQTHVPPTMDDSAATSTVFEQIIAVDTEKHRLAWKNCFPEWLLRAECWQALSTNGQGKTVYELREVLSGVGAYAIKLLLADKIRKSFEEMAEGLNAYAEK
ncbi:hypothetical protein BD413DRAFT_610339 [Trametes elegans]|nr:hypothetical protein BD413DRAFT_610339 [Trametes elegans]